MSKEKELKEAIEKNKIIRKSQGEELNAILKNSNTDGEMRKLRDLEEKKITRTSKDDKGDRKKKFIIIASFIALAAAIVIALVYFL